MNECECEYGFLRARMLTLVGSNLYCCWVLEVDGDGYLDLFNVAIRKTEVGLSGDRLTFALRSEFSTSVEISAS